MSVYRTEEEQLALIRDFWKKYQQAISAVLLVALLVFSAYYYWQRHVAQLQLQAASLYEGAMAAAARQEAGKMRAFSHRILEVYPRSAYGDFARLLLAKLAVEEGKLTVAEPLLNAVATHGYSPVIRQIAEARLTRVKNALGGTR